MSNLPRADKWRKQSPITWILTEFVEARKKIEEVEDEE